MQPPTSCSSRSASPSARHHYPTQLSGGEQQRIALARAFAARPALLLADEPTGNLDSRTGQNVLEMLDRLQRRSGTSLVLVTHDPATARLAERRLHLLDGHLVRDERGEPGVAGAVERDGGDDRDRDEAARNERREVGRTRASAAARDRRQIPPPPTGP